MLYLVHKYVVHLVVGHFAVNVVEQGIGVTQPFVPSVLQIHFG